ncbi:MAG: hypothetical protein OXU77_22395 [Gammaproteobacteria bacterium]|nr:hypothetical protein [Gammaproteobacteria bacterium]
MTRRTLLGALIAVAACILGSLGQAAESQDPAVSALPEAKGRPQARMLVVTGLGGEPDYARAFAQQGDASARHAEAAGAAVTLLTEEAASREGIRDAIEEIARESNETDKVVVQLIGHGTFDGEHYRFNVPGPDPTAEDLAAWLKPVNAKRQLAVIATSASGAAQGVLAREGRAVITATRHGRERNASLFGGFWADALDAPSADVDKDQRISGEEAFRFAERALATFYEDRQLIATEHPRLEGDAGSFIVARTAPGEPVEPELLHLVSRVDELTAAIDELKSDRRVLTDDDYFDKLQDLLLELARADQELKMRREDAPEPDAHVPFRGDFAR